MATRQLRRLPIPPRATCHEGVDDHENAKVLGFTELASIGRIDIEGDRAEVRFRAKVPANPKKTRRTARGPRRSTKPAVATAGRRRRPSLVGAAPPGHAPDAGFEDDNGPLGSDFYEDGLPSTWSSPGGSTVPGRDLLYRGRSYLVEDGRGDRRVFGFMITGRRAETARGVGIGDTLAFARRRYPQLRCDVVNQGSEYVTFPACRARIAPRRYLGFGQNPIRSISLMTVPFDGAR